MGLGTTSHGSIHATWGQVPITQTTLTVTVLLLARDSWSYTADSAADGKKHGYAMSASASHVMFAG